MKTREHFVNKTDCIEEYYGNTPWPIQGQNYYIPGERTLNENIADLGGVLQSYEAYGKNTFSCQVKEN